jgi:hypothetical protein
MPYSTFLIIARIWLIGWLFCLVGFAWLLHEERREGRRTGLGEILACLAGSFFSWPLVDLSFIWFFMLRRQSTRAFWWMAHTILLVVVVLLALLVRSMIA